jgi:hypothetical protein
MRTRTALIPVVAAAILLAMHTVEAVDVKVHADKKFDFRSVRTWAWNTNGAGDVRMARTAEDDPEAMRKEAEPIIMAAVNDELVRRGLMLATGAPDIAVTYYLLLTVGSTAQSLGQFLPATANWGLPPFAPATQSLEMTNQGALVLDLSAKDTVVWRGIARAKVEWSMEPAARDALLREAVRDLLRKLPKR